jgi:hypothetical protein
MNNLPEVDDLLKIGAGKASLLPMECWEEYEKIGF